MGRDRCRDPADRRGGFRLLTVAALALIAWCLPVLARRCGVPASRAVWIALAGPLVGAHLIAGPHNDALMIALLVAGLTMGGRRPLAMGALLTLAVLIKATALVVVPFALLLPSRRPSTPGTPWRPSSCWLPPALS